MLRELHQLMGQFKVNNITYGRTSMQLGLLAGVHGRMKLCWGGQWGGGGEGGIAKLQICKKCIGYGLVEILDTLKYHFSCFRGKFFIFPPFMLLKIIPIS